ncbi:MAG: formate/nitrite transporter family protein, partial [Bacilli bacterium]|nr:formate/nitrite transporter family protein [Bacilli bacterium]
DFLKPRLNVIFYAILAGASIAFGGFLFILSSAFIPNDFWVDKKLIGALLFPVGLLLVLYFKMNLYTGKIGPAFRNPNLDKKGLNTFEWLFWILIGNAIGAFLVGFAVYGLSMIDSTSSFSKAVVATGTSRNMEFTAEAIFGMIFKSMLCGILVYASVYLFGKLQSQFGKVLGVVIPISFFVYAGFQHCVANMFYLAASGQWNANFLVGLLLCILGNSVGAILIDLFVKYQKN